MYKYKQMWYKKITDTYWDFRIICMLKEIVYWLLAVDLEYFTFNYKVLNDDK